MMESRKEFHIRQASPGDAEKLAAMELICFPEEPWSLASLKTELSGLNETIYMIGEDPETNQVICYGGLWVIQDEGHITNVAVHPEHRRQGYGRALLEELLKKAETRGVKSETLEVRRSNLPAQALYKSMGFVELGCRKGYYANNHEDALIFWRDAEQL